MLMLVFRLIDIYIEVEYHYYEYIRQIIISQL